MHDKLVRRIRAAPLERLPRLVLEAERVGWPPPVVEAFGIALGAIQAALDNQAALAMSIRRALLQGLPDETADRLLKAWIEGNEAAPTSPYTDSRIRWLRAALGLPEAEPPCYPNARERG